MAENREENCVQKNSLEITDNVQSEKEQKSISEMTPEERTAHIERSLIKKFRKPIWRKFTKAVRDYKLIQEGDKIAVCISGGKDSMIMAKLFQEIQKH